MRFVCKGREGKDVANFEVMLGTIFVGLLVDRTMWLSESNLRWIVSIEGLEWEHFDRVEQLML